MKIVNIESVPNRPSIKLEKIEDIGFSFDGQFIVGLGLIGSLITIVWKVATRTTALEKDVLCLREDVTGLICEKKIITAKVETLEKAAVLWQQSTELTKRLDEDVNELEQSFVRVEASLEALNRALYTMQETIKTAANDFKQEIKELYTYIRKD